MRIDRELQAIFNAAFMEARQRKHEFLTPEHLLYAALHFDYPRDIVTSCGAEPDGIRQAIEAYLQKEMPRVEQGDPTQSVGFQSVIQRAFFHTESAEKETMDISDILVSIFDDERSYAAFFLRSADITRYALLSAIAHGIDQSEMQAKETQSEEGEVMEDEEGRADVRHAARDKQERSALKLFVTDLTALAKEGRLEPLIGREEILERTMQVLCRRLKNNPVHLGDPGVGKTALTEGLAARIAADEVPAALKGYSVLALDVAGMLAGARYRGDFEERMKQVISELEKREKIILFIDEIHTIVGAGAVTGSSLDASNMLKPALVSGRIRCIGSTTFEEYKRYFEKDRALSRRFQRIEVPEPSEAETVQILHGLRGRYEEFHNVRYSEEALQAAVSLSALYINDRFLPDKAIDIIDEAGASVRMKRQETEVDAGSIAIGEKEVEHVVAGIAKIPERSVSTSERTRLRDLDHDLRKVVFGQDEAIALVVSAIRRSRAGFRAPNRPVASFLFVGPTGVGKTELARQLAESFGVSLHRFDMSEYQEKHTVSRLIGSPPGYVGFEEGALLSDAVRRTPHAVLLLDEIEKAHPDIQNILLQIMDYATITDNAGKKADFRNVILIMTSNAGARDIGRPEIGFGGSRMGAAAAYSAVERIFSPEFRGRLDKVVVFNALAAEIVEDIVRKELELFGGQLSEKDIRLEYSDESVRWLARRGYSEEAGARNIARVVEDEVKAWFVDEVLFGKLARGGVARIAIIDDRIEIAAKSVSKSAPKRTSSQRRSQKGRREKDHTQSKGDPDS